MSTGVIFKVGPGRPAGLDAPRLLAASDHGSRCSPRLFVSLDARGQRSWIPRRLSPFPWPTYHKDSIAVFTSAYLAQQFLGVGNPIRKVGTYVRTDTATTVSTPELAAMAAAWLVTSPVQTAAVKGGRGVSFLKSGGIVGSVYQDGGRGYLSFNRRVRD